VGAAFVDDGTHAWPSHAKSRSPSSPWLSRALRTGLKTQPFRRAPPSLPRSRSTAAAGPQEHS